MKYIHNYRRFCVALAFLVPSISLAQSDWKLVQLDNSVSFLFPSDYKRTDTLGQENFHSRTDAGYLQAVKIPWPEANVTNEVGLTEHYVSLQNLMIERSLGDLVSDSTIQLNGLYVR